MQEELYLDTEERGQFDEGGKNAVIFTNLVEKFFTQCCFSNVMPAEQAINKKASNPRTGVPEPSF